MATNPLYPIVPCHRVVGAGMSLVGYGGRQDEEALAARRADSQRRPEMAAAEAGRRQAEEIRGQLF